MCSEACQKVLEKFAAKEEMKSDCMELKKRIRETVTKDVAIQEALVFKTAQDETPLTVHGLNQLLLAAAKVTTDLIVAKEKTKAAGKHYSKDSGGDCKES